MRLCNGKNKGFFYKLTKVSNNLFFSRKNDVSVEKLALRIFVSVAVDHIELFSFHTCLKDPVLTRRISAIIDQHRFNVTSARKTNKKHHDVEWWDVINVKYAMGVDMNRPQAQMRGSHCVVLLRNV